MDPLSTKIFSRTPTSPPLSTNAVGNDAELALPSRYLSDSEITRGLSLLQNKSIAKAIQLLLSEDMSEVKACINNLGIRQAVRNAVRLLLVDAKELSLVEDKKLLLLLAASVVQRLSAIGACVDKPNENGILSTLVINLQKFAPLVAIDVLTDALLEGAKISQETALSTLVAAVKSARNPKDLEAIVRYAKEAVHSGTISSRSQKAAGCFDALLGSCGEPSLTSIRISPYYQDCDMVDVAHRLLAIAPLAQSLVKEKFPFYSDLTVGRFNCLLRALSSVSLALDVEQVRHSQYLTVSEKHQLQKELSLDFDWPATLPERRDPALLRGLSHSLTMQGLLLADGLLGWNGIGTASFTPRYKITGSTINQLFHACFFDEVDLSLEAVALLRSIFERALHCPEIRKKLHSSAIENGFYSTMRAACSNPEALSALQSTTAILAKAMQSGFGFKRSGLERVHSLCAAALTTEVPIENSEWIEDIRYLTDHLERRPRPARKNVSIPPERLKGGLDFSLSNYLSSFADLSVPGITSSTASR